MKKFLVILMSVISLSCFANKEDLYGEWKYESTVITFTADSMFITCPIEGFSYTWKLVNNTISYRDMVDTYFDCDEYISIINLDKRYLTIKWDGDEKEYTFCKINNK